MIIESFHKTVLQNPSKIALISSKEKDWTYTELFNRSKSIADRIGKLGIPPFSVIAVYMPRSANTIATILGILMAKCIYLPIDLRNPKSRVEKFLRVECVAGIFTHKDLIKNLEFSEKYSDHEIFGMNFLHFERAIITNPQINPDSLYLLYTSGSTGESKGVLGTHSGLLNRINWMQKSYPASDAENFLLNSSLSFVDSVCEIFLPLLNGYALHVPDDTITSNPSSLAEYVFHNKISRLVLGPTILSTMLDHVENVNKALSSLSILTLSGQELQAALVYKFRKKFPNLTLLNIYGSTEVAADALYYEVPKQNWQKLNVIPIGKPIENVAAFLIDENNNILSNKNDVGEICIQGVCLAQGYLNYSPNIYSPFGYHPINSEVPIYKTGDLGYIDENDNFVYVGRLDNQFKVNGQKVNRGEIETVACELPDVSIASLVMKDKKLILYVELSKQTQPSTTMQKIRSHIASSLPIYMLPNKIIIIDKIPLNVNGKTDYLSLEKLNDNVKSLDVPIGALEYSLFYLFQEILGLDLSSFIDEGFFELGGNSLLANVLITKIKQKFKVDLTFNDLYNNSTPKGIAIIIRDKLSKNSNNNYDSFLVNISENPEEENIIIYLPSILGSQGHFRNLIQKLPKSTSYEISLKHKEKIPYQDIESFGAICCKFIKENLDINDTKKLFLIGWSFGGVVAYSTTLQLIESGIKVNGLVMLDSFNPLLFYNTNQEEERSNLYDIMLKTNKQAMKAEYLERYNKVLKHNISILWKYKPRMLKNCPVLLIKAKTYNNKASQLIETQYNGWENLISGDFRIKILEADHFDILSDRHLKQLSMILINEFKINI